MDMDALNDQMKDIFKTLGVDPENLKNQGKLHKIKFVELVLTKKQEDLNLDNPTLLEVTVTRWLSDPREVEFRESEEGNFIDIGLTTYQLKTPVLELEAKIDALNA